MRIPAALVLRFFALRFSPGVTVVEEAALAAPGSWSPEGEAGGGETGSGLSAYAIACQINSFLPGKRAYGGGQTDLLDHFHLARLDQPTFCAQRRPVASSPWQRFL